jgi:hypothetical protein
MENEMKELLELPRHFLFIHNANFPSVCSEHNQKFKIDHLISTSGTRSFYLIGTNCKFYLQIGNPITNALGNLEFDHDSKRLLRSRGERHRRLYSLFFRLAASGRTSPFAGLGTAV